MGNSGRLATRGGVISNRWNNS